MVAVLLPTIEQSVTLTVMMARSPSRRKPLPGFTDNQDWLDVALKLRPLVPLLSLVMINDCEAAEPPPT
jgi:hypothetical protein